MAGGISRLKLFKKAHYGDVTKSNHAGQHDKRGADIAILQTKN